MPSVQRSGLRVAWGEASARSSIPVRPTGAAAGCARSGLFPLKGE